MPEDILGDHKTLRSWVEEKRSSGEFEQLFRAIAREFGIDDENAIKALEQAHFVGFATALMLLEQWFIRCLQEFRGDYIALEKGHDPLTVFGFQYLHFMHGDEKKVNEWEKTAIRTLREIGLSYRDIAMVFNRSVDTIHRIAKDVEVSNEHS